MFFIFLSYFTLYNGLQFHPSHQNWFKWILFTGWVIFRGVYVPQLPYPIICWWTSRLLPCPGYCKQCCDEHWGARVSFRSGFLSVYAQEWDCWVIWQFCLYSLNGLSLLPILSPKLSSFRMRALVIFCSHAGGSDSEESACNAGDLGLVPGLGRSPGGGTGYPCQDSGLENSMDGGAWRATVHGVTKRPTQLSDFHFA